MAKHIRILVVLLPALLYGLALQSLASVPAPHPQPSHEEALVALPDGVPYATLPSLGITFGGTAAYPPPSPPKRPPSFRDYLTAALPSPPSHLPGAAAWCAKAKAGYHPAVRARKADLLFPFHWFW